jgi:hypothetical protein
MTDLDNHPFLLGERLNNKFANDCYSGDLNSIKDIYKHHSINNLKKKLFYVFRKIAGQDIPILDPHYSDDSALINACQQNHYDIVEFLLKDKDFMQGLISSNKKDETLTRGINHALGNNNLEMFKLISPLIDKKDIFFHMNISSGYTKACQNSNLNMLDLFFADKSINPPHLNNLQPENMPATIMLNGMISENRDKLTTIAVSGIKNNGLLAACISGSLDTVKYFTESTNSNHYVNIDMFFKNKEANLLVGSFEVMEYLIFNLNIDKNLYLNGKVKLSSIFDQDDHQNVINLFEKRDLFKEINNEINNSTSQAINPPKKKPKI